jgi:alpha-tubulin suppressor-like RCC1 family protein
VQVRPARSNDGSRRRGSAVIRAAIVAAFTLGMAAPASAASHGALAWGFNEAGELGNGSTTQSNVPVPVSGLSSGVSAVSGGFFHSLAVLSNGTVMAWGMNHDGQLGNGNTTQSNVPVTVSGLSGATAASAGGSHSLARLSNGTVMGWGANGSGQLGNGSTTSSNVPVAVSGLSKVTAISAGEGHSLARLSSGAVMAWGFNYAGQLGNGGTTTSDVPVAVGGLGGATGVAAGFQHSLALLSNGTVAAWGDNEDGQLGDGTSSGPEQCGTVQTPCSQTPVAVSGLSGVSVVSAGAYHSLALLSTGTVMAWGDNNDGQLGDGTTTNRSAPVAVVGLSGVTAIAAGGNHSIALLSNGSTTNSSVPLPVSELSGVTLISAGGYHSLAYSPPPEALPEFGRCVFVGAGGQYTGANCLAEAPGKGKYNWVPAEKKKFSGKLGVSTLETVGKAKIICSAATSTGEYTAAKTATATIAFSGCESARGPCQSATAKPGEILTSSLQGSLGFIKNEVKEGKLLVSVGLDLKGESSLATAECGSTVGAKQLVALEGSVIAPISPIDKMSSESTLKYKALAGTQIPESFQSGGKDTLSTTFISGLEKTTEQTGLSATGSIKNEEPLEIKAKV